ncbi:hypothetical protein [Massiliimalia timonensis]|uniref:hypothetical protein n=1 Tax=Massiliimalia timonensis TaxID=1987501 RepID=UPI001939C844|nr:hypothetical protein [Massiliimalia timonensis]
MNEPDQKVICEIEYYISYSLLKRLMEQKQLTQEECREANVAIAERYGVSTLDL